MTDSPMLSFFRTNLTGRDFVVGDIHGCFSELERALERVQFDRSRDRLFAVGDLVDRGPESPRALEFLAQPWFHSVRGNHEQMAIDVFDGRIEPYAYNANGGAWFLALPRTEQARYVTAFQELPHVIEFDHPDGSIGVVHADCPLPRWRQFCENLPTSQELKRQSLWSRDRIHEFNVQRVEGIRALVVGHMPLSAPVVLGNVYHIDTAARSDRGYFTLLEVGISLTLHELRRQCHTGPPSLAR